MARNGDGLFRRDGIWYFKYRNECGVYREKSTGKRKQGEARDYKHDFLEKLRQNQLPTDEATWTLAQALERWMEFRAATRPKASVAAEQTSCRHLKEVIGAGRRLGALTAWDIRRYQMKRMGAAAPKTINNEMLVLTAVLKTRPALDAVEGGLRASRNSEEWTRPGVDIGADSQADRDGAQK